ncbi:hypothetical protein HMPREF1869_01384 [Bacteroidales bacterium KA00251]|nr:hypothetical protein HMPREF1869_01384 [Bacteroidales bacterium KA00251]
MAFVKINNKSLFFETKEIPLYEKGRLYLLSTKSIKEQESSIHYV